MSGVAYVSRGGMFNWYLENYRYGTLPPPSPPPTGIPSSNPPGSGDGSGGGSSSPPPPPPNCSVIIDKYFLLTSRIEPQVAVFRRGNIQFKRSHEVLVPLWDIIAQASNNPTYFYRQDGKDFFNSTIMVFDAVNFVWLKREGDNIIFTCRSFMQDSDFYSLVRLQNLENSVFFNYTFKFVTQAFIVFSQLTNSVEVLMKFKEYEATDAGWNPPPCGGQYTITDLGEHVTTFFSENIGLDPSYSNLYFFELLRDLQDGESVVFITPFGNAIYNSEVSMMYNYRRYDCSDPSVYYKNCIYPDFFEKARPLLKKLADRLGVVPLGVQKFFVYCYYSKNNVVMYEYEELNHPFSSYRYAYPDNAISNCQHLLPSGYYGSYAIMSDLTTITPETKIHINITGQKAIAAARIQEVVSLRGEIRLKENIASGIAKTKIKQSIVYIPTAKIQQQVQGNRAVARLEQHILQPTKITESIMCQPQAVLVEFIYRTRGVYGFGIVENVKFAPQAKIVQEVNANPSGRAVTRIREEIASASTQQIQPQAGIVQSVVNKLQAHIRQNILSKAQAKIRINIAGNTSHVVRIYEDSEHIMLMLM